MTLGATREGLIERLRARTNRSLPKDWQKGRNCPECDVGAERPKCFYDLGGSCPRHDPNNYEPSPYVMVPDALCQEAADTVERLERALTFYRDEAEALQSAMSGQPSGNLAAITPGNLNRIDAILTVLSLDGGKRARTVLNLEK
jgi:hypothetical protein